MGDTRALPSPTSYDRYGFVKGTGGGFAFNVYSEVNGDPTTITLNDLGQYTTQQILDEFYGTGRQEIYREMAWTWFLSAPPLTAGSECRVGIKTYGNYYFAATNGGGSTLYASATSKTNPNAALTWDKID